MRAVLEEFPLTAISEREPFLAMSAEEEKRDLERAAVASEDGPSEGIFHHKIDADEALQAFAGHEGEYVEIDEATNRRLLRKIDLNIMPVS